MAIDLSKPASTYDSAALAQQPRLTQSQMNVQQQQQQQAVQSGVLTPNGGTDTPASPNGNPFNPNQLPTFEQGINRGNNNTYSNNASLSNVLPSDGGSGEAAGAGANAAANEFLNSVDFSNPLFAFKPLSNQESAGQQSADVGNDTTSPNSDAAGNAVVQNGFGQGGPDNVVAQRLVNIAVDRAKQNAQDDGSGNGIGDPSSSDAVNNPPSLNTQDSPQQQLEQDQGSTTSQQKARDAANQLTQNQPGGKPGTEPGQNGKPGNGATTVDGHIVEPELASELNIFLKQQLQGQPGGPKAKALLALLRGDQTLEEALEQSAHEVLGARGEATLMEGLGGEAGGMSLSEMRGALAMRGEAAVLGQAGEQVLNNSVMNNSRMLVMLMSNMPSPGNSQPVLAMIAADIFRLQSLRLELMASSRCADEDGDMPPIDEDEAAMKQRQIQGIDRGSMWRWDLRPRTGGELEEEEENTAQIWFRTALLTCALQRPNTVAPMFQSTEQAHSVRLFEQPENEQDAFKEHWVQIPTEQTALESFAVNSEHFATWVNLAEQAFGHAKLGPSPIISDDRSKNARAQATALEAIVGKPAYAMVRDIDEDEEARRTFFKAICRSNSPKSLPTVITTMEATFKEDGLRPAYAYGVLGAFVKDDQWSVILCEDRGSDPQAQAAPEESLQSDKSFRIFSVPYQAVHRNAASVVFLPG